MTSPGMPNPPCRGDAEAGGGSHEDSHTVPAFPARPLPAKNPPEKGRELFQHGLQRAGGAGRAGKARAEGRRKETELERGQILTGSTAGLGTGPELQKIGAAAAPAQDGDPGVTQLVGCSS